MSATTQQQWPWSSRYDSRAAIEAAESKLRDGGGGVSEAQTAYQSALLDWVDDVTMGDVVADGDDAARAAIANEIAELWLGYAGLNRRSNLVSDDDVGLVATSLALFFRRWGDGHFSLARRLFINPLLFFGFGVAMRRKVGWTPPE